MRAIHSLLLGKQRDSMIKWSALATMVAVILSFAPASTRNVHGAATPDLLSFEVQAQRRPTTSAD